jgi:hypothetical protein
MTDRQGPPVSGSERTRDMGWTQYAGVVAQAGKEGAHVSWFIGSGRWAWPERI